MTLAQVTSSSRVISVRLIVQAYYTIWIDEPETEEKNRISLMISLLTPQEPSLAPLFTKETTGPTSIRPWCTDAIQDLEGFDLNLAELATAINNRDSLMITHK